jgi:hypothetical protein
MQAAVLSTVGSLLEKIKAQNLPFDVSQLPAPTTKNVLLGVAGAIGAAAIYEQIWLKRSTKGMPGPSYSLPFLGSMLEIIKNPHEYYERQRMYGDLSWSHAFGQ